MDKLKPCPFCGGEAEVISHRFFSEALNDWKTESYGVACKSCNTSGYQFFGCEIHAIKAWNRRANDAPVWHGCWIGEGDGYADGEIVYDVWHCSECDYCIDDGTDNPELLPKYCAGCGALMDGGNEDDS